MNPAIWAAMSLLSVSDWSEGQLPSPGSSPVPDQPKSPPPDSGVALRFRLERAVRKANNWRKRNHLPPLDPLALESLATKIVMENKP